MYPHYWKHNFLGVCMDVRHPKKQLGSWTGVTGQWDTRSFHGLLILYLHQDSSLTIIHCNLKVKNVLLDSDLNPKKCGFWHGQDYWDLGLIKPLKIQAEYLEYSKLFSSLKSYELKSLIIIYMLKFILCFSGYMSPSMQCMASTPQNLMYI